MLCGKSAQKVQEKSLTLRRLPLFLFLVVNNNVLAVIYTPDIFALSVTV